MSTGRSTTTRDRHRAAIRRTKPDCGICLEPIDYDLRWPDLRCYVVDHIIPIDSGKTPEERAALDVLSNKQAAHHDCNRRKWHRTDEVEDAPRSFVTTRSW